MNLPLITGIILAGGQARRMNGEDKGLVPLFGKPLYQHVLEKLRPQVNNIVINANRNIPTYQQSGYAVITDSIDNYPGPLAGILAGLEFSQTEWTMFVPCDTPFIPDNLVQHLWQNRKGHHIVYASDEEREHPTLCLIHNSQIAQLKQFLANGDKKLMLFMAQANAKAVIFPNSKKAFENINTLEACSILEKENNHG